MQTKSHISFTPFSQLNVMLSIEKFGKCSVKI